LPGEVTDGSVKEALLTFSIIRTGQMQKAAVTRGWEGGGVSATLSFEYLKNARIKTNVPDELRALGFRVPIEGRCAP